MTDPGEDRAPAGQPPLADYGFLGDCRNWALVSRHGAVDWCCFQVRDSRTAFARILDLDRGGHCTVRPTSEADGRQQYLPGTNVLVTTFSTDDGTLEVTDALLLRRGDDTGSGVDVASRMQLARRIRCTRGEVEVRVEVAPRFDHGLTSCHVRRRDDDRRHAVVGGRDALELWSDLPLTSPEWSHAAATAILSEGEERWLSIEYLPSEDVPDDDHVDDLSAETLAARLDETVGFWRDWSDACTYDGRYREEVVRSALVLKGLTDARTGGVAAAPTTSLPEQVGGERNWDYRYVWLRDASSLLGVLFDLGYEAEARSFTDWLSRATAGSSEDLQVMYDLAGGRMLHEVTLDQLAGYRGSSPVRVGNAAAQQFQLDVYGELVQTVHQLVEQGGELSEEMRHLLTDMLAQLGDHWQDPDAGIWEQRGTPEHFTSSKLYAWAAAEGIRQLADDGHLPDVDVADCAALRDDIRDRIERYGVDLDTGAVMRAFGRDEMDAANLLAGLIGFFPPDDDRVTATLERVLDELGEGELVRRYHTDDGLQGEQNPFLWTSFWVVELLAVRGEVDRARERFEALLDRCSPLGLLSEECDGDTGELVGNYPQAISHVGLVRAALALAEATR